MANILIQETTQQAKETIPTRLIVQYVNDANEDKQTITNYEDLTTEEKATFDAYQALCESKMV